MFGADGRSIAFSQVGPAEPLIAEPAAMQFPQTGPQNSRPPESLIVEPGMQSYTGQSQFFPSTAFNGAMPNDLPNVSVDGAALYPHEIIPHPLDQTKLVSVDDHNIKELEPEEILPKALDLYDLSLARYTAYRYEEDAVSWMPGDGEQFGWLSFESPNYLNRTQKSGITANMNLHLLSGPQSVHLPPRLYDFELGYQARNTLSDLFSYEWSAMVGVYSDFEDSARDGVRFPAHAVGMFHPGPRA